MIESIEVPIRPRSGIRLSSFFSSIMCFVLGRNFQMKDLNFKEKFVDKSSRILNIFCQILRNLYHRTFYLFCKEKILAVL